MQQLPEFHHHDLILILPNQLQPGKESHHRSTHPRHVGGTFRCQCIGPHSTLILIVLETAGVVLPTHNLPKPRLIPKLGVAHVRTQEHLLHEQIAEDLRIGQVRNQL